MDIQSRLHVYYKEFYYILFITFFQNSNNLEKIIIDPVDMKQLLSVYGYAYKYLKKFKMPGA